jgi:predicted house-cleaning noncanonical NTP pyrophosphatase (MazG superfamily)
VTSGLQAYTLLVSRLLEAAAEQLTPRELAALHDVLIELVARAVEARRLKEAA